MAWVYQRTGSAKEVYDDMCKFVSSIGKLGELDYDNMHLIVQQLIRVGLDRKIFTRRMAKDVIKFWTNRYKDAKYEEAFWTGTLELFNMK